MLNNVLMPLTVDDNEEIDNILNGCGIGNHRRLRNYGTVPKPDGFIYRRYKCVYCGKIIIGNEIVSVRRDNCNHDNLVKVGFKYCKDIVYQRLQCKDCGAVIKGKEYNRYNEVVAMV